MKPTITVELIKEVLETLSLEITKTKNTPRNMGRTPEFLLVERLKYLMEKS